KFANGLLGFAGNILTGVITGGRAGSVGKAQQLGPTFSINGAYADGGNPPIGKVSLVGERGPELFVPKTQGTIIPNHQLGGGGPNIQVTNVFHISTGVQQTVRAEINAMLPTIEKRSVGAV